MATRAELPELVLLEREAELATFRSLADAARGGEGARRRDRGHRRDRQDAAAGRGARQLRATACACSPRAPASTRATSRSASCGSSSSRCSRPRRPSSAPSSSPAPPRSPSRSSTPRTWSRAPSSRATRQFAMMHGLYWLTANLAFEQPTMLAIDDLHWADTPVAALALLPRAAARGAAAARRRDHAAARAGPRPRAPHRAAGRPGDDGDPARAAAGPSRSHALIRRRFDEDGDEGFAAAVEAATRGNPLLVLALLDTVAREGVRPQADQAHRAARARPGRRRPRGRAAARAAARRRRPR